MTDAITDMLRSVALFLPKALAFVAILVVGLLIARVLRTATDKILERVHFDRAVERGGIKTALARSKYDASDIVAKLVYYALVLFTLQLAFGIFGPNPVSNLLNSVVAWLPKAFVAVIIVVVAAAVASAVKDVLSNALAGLSYGRMIANAASWFLIGLGVIAALNQVGIATAVTTPILITVLATIAGILIVGVGGGLVRPMSQRWESWLDRAAQESQTIAERAQAFQAGRRDMTQATTAEAPSTQAEPAYAGATAGAPATGTMTGSGSSPSGTATGSGSAPSAAGAYDASYEQGTAPVYQSEQPTQILPPTGGQNPRG